MTFQGLAALVDFADVTIMRLRTLSTQLFAVLIAMMVLGTARAAAADTISLMWDANPEPEIAGYVVHVGTQPGTYTQHLDVGLSTVHSFTGAVAGQQYCFAVSAYFSGPIEGPKSAEVCGFSNRPPTLVNPGARSSLVSQATTLQLQGVDPDGQSVSYTTTGLPPGLALQSSTGFISGTPTTAGSFSVIATASDGWLTASQSFTWTITSPDVTAPAVTVTGPTSAATYSTAGTTVALSGTASDNVGVVQVTWVNSRGGSGTATGTTSWSVSTVTLQAGTNVLTVTARDAAGNTASDLLTVTVNGTPTLTNPGARSSAVGQSTSLQLAGSDPNGDTLSYSVTGLPPGLSLTASNGLIAGTPVMTGSYQVTASVSDGVFTASQAFTWTITSNAAATGTIRLAWNAVTEPGIAGYFVYAGVQPGVHVQKLDAGLVTTFTFTNAVIGQRYCFAVSAYLAGPVEGPKSAEVCGYTNAAPTLASVSNQSSSVGQSASLQLAGSDPEGSILTYSATGLPAGLSVAATTGLISGTPSAAGSYSVTATVSDGALSASRTFTWTVTADTIAPVIAITTPTSAANYASVADTVALGGTATDQVGVTQISWANNRGGSGTATGTSSWSVPGIALLGGSNVITVTARDAAGNTSSAVITVTRNVAPVLASVSAQTTEAGKFGSVQLSGSDADGDALTYGANGLPPGLMLTVSTGLISGTPTEPGTYSVTAVVFDAAQSASRTFTWTVTADVTGPVVGITTPTSAASYSTTASTVTLGGVASDNAGVTQVSWSNDRGGSGVATGTTNWSAVVTLQGGVNVVTVTARDANGNTAAAVIRVTRNTAPSFSTPPNQWSRVGRWDSYQLSASDPDGDVLTYSATGLPPGLVVNATTGRISGTPTTVGDYWVTARVSDGTSSRSRSFTWTVRR